MNKVLNTGGFFHPNTYFSFAMSGLIVGTHWPRAERPALSTDYGSGPLQPGGY